MKIRPIGYEVLITPLTSKDIYGDVVDVTKDVHIEDYIKEKGISTILREVDNGDFDFGVFVYNSINIVCINFSGKFSDVTDSRSIFKYSRDKAKVKVNFYDGVTNDPAISFRGLIDDRASTLDFVKDEVKITVLSEDSILNRLKYLAGTVPNGSMASEAIRKILNRPDVTSILNLDPLININVENDYALDDVEEFEDKTLKEVLDGLMVVTNSILYVDRDSNIIVRSRIHNSEEVFSLFGEGDTLGRRNIIEIKEYNTGLQRTFNTVVWDEQSFTNEIYAAEYGDNKKSIDYKFITNTITRALICRNLVDWFKAPKVELVVTCKTSLVNHLGFCDLVSVDYPYKKKPFEGTKLPTYGSAIYGEARYPYIAGSLKILDNMAFKIIGMEEDTQNFVTRLKLRQVGVDVVDGWFSTMTPNDLPARYGFSIYGTDKYTEDGL